MALDRIEGLNLYIGGVLSLRNKDALQKANITHVVSVLRMRPDETLTEGFEHFRVEVDDVEDEDLLQYFTPANAFIQSGLDAGGGVLVHCAMGKSRSASICIAYLLHRQSRGSSNLNPESALELVRKSRAIAEPNEDFMKQLWLYHEMGCPDDVVNHPTYLRWLSHRQIELSAACGRAPEMDTVRFEDELPRSNEVASAEKVTEIRCRKCRRMLATTPFINPHDKNDKPSASNGAECAHIFLHPLTWMRPSLFPDTATYTSSTDISESHDDTPLSGRLTCPNPKCEANVGKFAWQGLRCSCGKWVVPAIGVARARVDVNTTDRSSYAAADADATTANASGLGGSNASRLGAMGIRLPPHMRTADQATAAAATTNDDQTRRNNRGFL